MNTQQQLFAVVLIGAAALTASAQTPLEEVVVTAQFRAQNVQDIPIAVTALTGETLDARGQNTIEFLPASVPCGPRSTSTRSRSRRSRIEAVSVE